MGIGLVLLIWAIVGAAFAANAAFVFGFAAAYLTRGAKQPRKGLILVASLFPLVCFGWAAGVFVLQAVVNETVFHRDAGLGDAWTCRLPNGYSLLMIDTTDHGFVYNPRTQEGGAVGEQEDSIAGVRVIQVSGRYILGGSSRSLTGADNDTGQLDSYFLLDTEVGRHTNFSSYDDLSGKAHELGIVLNLERIETVYGQYSSSWFGVFVGLLLLLPPVLGAALLVRWLIRVRKTRSIA